VKDSALLEELMYRAMGGGALGGSAGLTNLHGRSLIRPRTAEKNKVETSV
jgi:hypothetical protein